jgi:protein SCO1/2
MRALRPLLIALLLAGLASAPGAAAAELKGVFGGVGIEEHLGSTIPLSARFTDDDGTRVTLADLFTRPTILALVYYRCPNACDFLLTGMADAFKALPGAPGKDYQVLTVTIDPRETVADAREAKRIALQAIQAPFPPEAWRFLTGDAQNIDQLASAVGFHYAKNGNDFDHPLGLVVLSPKGKIVRYMTGTDFLPVDLKMSIMEASTGTVGPTIAKVLRFCFSYDPQNRNFVFNTLKVTAIVTLTIAAGFVLYLVLSTRRRNNARRG